MASVIWSLCSLITTEHHCSPPGELPSNCPVPPFFTIYTYSVIIMARILRKTSGCTIFLTRFCPSRALLTRTKLISRGLTRNFHSKFLVHSHTLTDGLITYIPVSLFHFSDFVHDPTEILIHLFHNF